MKSKILKNSRKAQIHVEMVVSFVLFVGFVLFLLLFLNPIGKENLSFSSLDKVQEKLLNNLTVNYKSVMMVLETVPTADKGGKCYQFATNEFLVGKLVAYDSGGDKRKVNFKLGGADKIELQVKAGEKAYKILSSDVFVEDANSDSCPDSSSLGDSSWGVVENTRAVFEGYLENLVNIYKLDYNKLKENWGIEKDFDFVVYDETGANELKTVRGVLKNVKPNNILSRDIPLTMIDAKGVKVKIILNLRVW